MAWTSPGSILNIMASSNPPPFAELHLHLEGSIDADLLCRLDPTLSRAQADAFYAFDNFPAFLQSFKSIVLRLREPDHYRLAARALFNGLHAQGIVYAEIIHSAGVNLWRGYNAHAIVEALIEEGRRAPLEVRWILDAVRQFGADHVYSTAQLAAHFAGDDVVAFGIGGDETGAPAQDLKPAYDLARRSDLRLTAHAGETSSAENVWDTLTLGVDRIGHGIRSIEDPKLIAHLAEHEIPLEISLTSNVKTGAVESLSAHPAKRLYDAGVPIVLNTDDPALFQTTLAGEYVVADKVLGFTPADLERLRQNAFRYAFAYRGSPATAPHPPSPPGSPS
jgi:adenosine deaminase/aminodeoxyfutalosine deaminase